MSINPIMLAGLHQQAIRDKHAQIQADASCIRQLLVGRSVRRKDRGGVYIVTEIKMGLFTADVRGRLGGTGRVKHIGTIAELEIVEEKP